MTKEEKKQVTSVPVGVTEMTHLAVGICRLKDGSYAVARVEYNPETQEAKVVKLVPEDDRLSAMERFKIIASKEVL